MTDPVVEMIINMQADLPHPHLRSRPSPCTLPEHHQGAPLLGHDAWRQRNRSQADILTCLNEKPSLEDAK